MRAQPIPIWRQPSVLWLWLVVSAGLHALLIFFGIAAGGGRGLMPGRGTQDGDGFGGDTVDLEIAGPDVAAPVGSINAGGAIARAPAEPVAPAAEEEPAAPITADDGTFAARETRERRERREPQERPASAARSDQVTSLIENPIPHSGDPMRSENAAPGEADRPSGTGADRTAGGAPAGDPRSLILGAAGIGDGSSARRALLPNGGSCGDPVVGTWRTQKFRAEDRTWVRFVLRIRRDGDRLSGTITSRIWRGSAGDPTPGECTAFGMDHTWLMEAEGRLEGDRVSFDARRLRLVREDCPSSGSRYAPDHFSGTVRALPEALDVVNNDGAYDIDEPYTFRRISCD